MQTSYRILSNCNFGKIVQAACHCMAELLVKIDPEVRNNLYRVDVEATMLLLT